MSDIVTLARNIGRFLKEVEPDDQRRRANRDAQRRFRARHPDRHRLYAIRRNGHLCPGTPGRPCMVRCFTPLCRYCTRTAELRSDA